MNVYQRTMRRLSTTGWFRWILSKVLTPLDMRLKGTRFAPSAMGVDFPLCYLTVIGRRSGEPRTVPLLFIETAVGYAVVGTNFGRKHHPGWVYNLETASTATLEIDGIGQAVVVERMSPNDAKAVWDEIDGVWPGYETYRDMTDRDIRVFLLTPSNS